MNVFAGFLFAFLAVVGSTNGAPLEERIETDPELTAGYFEGDIVLPDTPRNGLISKARRWPNNTVYYKINEGFFDEEHRNHILRGMEVIEEVSCIRFKAVTDSEPRENYVNITGFRGGCYSSVGWLNRVQNYNLQIHPLDTGCFQMGTIVHEFLHTLGFFHMQSASNRDDYVRIVKENIVAGMEHNFNKYAEDVVDNFDQEYDYGSILHYPAYAFSANGKKTIVPLKSEEASRVMGQRRILTKSDVRKLNIMYKCPKKV